MSDTISRNREVKVGIMAQQDSLNHREIEILHLMQQGLTNKEIGERLALATDTVRWYNKRIYQTLSVNSRREAIHRAGELGLLTSTADRPAFSQSPVLYARSSDLHIAYQVVGNGPLDVLFIGGFVSHLEITWEEPELVHFIERMASFSRFIVFDKRGVGLSDRIAGAPTLEETVADAIAVLDAAGSQRAVLFGISEGGAATLLFAAAHPERVQSLMIYGASPKLIRTGDEPSWAVPREAFERTLDRLRQTWGGPYAVELFAPSRAADSQFRAWWARLLRIAASPGSVLATFEIQRDIDVCAILPTIHVPTLVIHRTDDRIVRIGAGRAIAASIPNAKFIELSGADHLFWIHGDDLIDEIQKFLAEEPSDSQRRQVLATVLDLEMGRASVGIQKTIAAQIERFGGQAVLVSGQDGIAVFDAPSRAIQCARAIREALSSAGLQIRAGLHTGECEIGDQELRGQVAEIAHGIASQAAPGDILVTKTTIDLIAGSTLRFQAHAPYRPEPAGGEIRLFSVQS